MSLSRFRFLLTKLLPKIYKRRCRDRDNLSLLTWNVRVLFAFFLVATALSHNQPPHIRFACYEWRVSTKPHNITRKLLMTDFVIEGYPVICRVDRWRGESRNKFLSSFFVVVVVVDVARKLVNTSHVYVCTFHVNLGPSQSLPCFCLHPGTRLIKLEVWTLCTDVIRLLATVAIRHLGGKRPGLLMRWCAYLGWL